MSEATDNEFNDAWDVYQYDQYLGTVGLIDGFLVYDAPDEKVLHNMIDELRKYRPNAKSDAEVFAAMPDFFSGTVHLRPVGDIEGLQSASEL
jgi:hypothetical protein